MKGVDDKKEEKWVKIGERAYLPFSFSLNGSQNSKKYLKSFGDFNIKDKALFFENRFYWPVGEVDAVANYQINEYKKEGVQYLWQMAQKCEEHGNSFRKKIEQLINENIETRKARADNFRQMMEEYRKFVVWMSMPWALENFFGQELHKILSKRNLKERVEIEKKLNQPLKQNDGEMEQISLLKIASLMKDDNDFSLTILKKVEDHIKKYGWLPMRWLVGKPMNQNDIKARLKTMQLSNFKAKLEELEQHTKKIEQETQEIIEQLKLDPEEKELILLLKEYVFIRTFRSDLINRTFFMIMPRLSEAAKELGLSYDEILMLSYQEIIDCLVNPKKIKDIKLEERKKSWLLFRDAEDIKILSGEEAKKFAKEQSVLEEIHSAVEEVRGNTAYKGVVSGRAKIVSNPNDISKVERGDILVAVMTFPSYIAAMEKASAFVTDEGGVLCHAAIVAREMKKPCVIATKAATKIFSDGDLIEVNGDKGIVKVLKRADK